jgi:hypothetical protein
MKKQKHDIRIEIPRSELSEISGGGSNVIIISGTGSGLITSSGGGWLYMDGSVPIESGSQYIYAPLSEVYGAPPSLIDDPDGWNAYWDNIWFNEVTEHIYC